ncbi:GNAT family N-acetyltransferase [Halobacterium wangiae]|uniref:GNAT family N-acetyltransferase n=1 Tax=Halobacterium wangiae TaxID=2902623 RepID=UPI001E4BF56A|nr:GNAT family N-acetyltransferase [Halobacterium wangiae]
MPGAAFLHGDRLALHPVTDEDHEFVQDHWNDPAVRRGFARYRPQRPSDVASFLDDEGAVHFLVCRDGDPVGFLWLFDVEDVMGRAELGYWVAPDEQGQGYATEAAELGVRYAFDDRGLHRVMARVFATNEASRRVLEAVGFEREGTLRDHYYVDGDHVDAHVYGLLDGD